MKQDAGYGDYFASSQMSGSNHSTTPTATGQKTYTQAEIDQLASDPDTWEKHRDDVRAAMADGRVRD